jgi:hypothetical protein
MSILNLCSRLIFTYLCILLFASCQNNANALLKTAKELSEDGQNDKALVLVNQAIEIDPENACQRVCISCHRDVG